MLQRTSLTLDKIIQFVHLVLCYGVTFSGAGCNVGGGGLTITLLFCKVKNGRGESLGAQLNFWVMHLLFQFLNYQSDPPDGLSRDRSQELPWLHEAIVSSNSA